MKTQREIQDAQLQADRKRLDFDHQPSPTPNTPTPWKIEYEGDAEKCHPAIIMARPLEIRVSRAEDFGDPLPDAAYIVTAVNSHQAMLETLKSIAIQAAANCINVAALELQVKKAIAKAEGK